jgi:cyanophycinase
VGSNPTSSANNDMIGNGCVIAIGGNEDKRGAHDSLLAEFIRRAGGCDARIVVIPSASAEPVRRAQQYTRIFTKLGAAAVRAVHAEIGATPDDLLLIENATGIFVAGGDQELLMRHLRRTSCAAAVVQAVRNGAVYCGTSAGAAAVSKKMIYQSDDNIVRFTEGLGLIPSVIVDQHFSERLRLGRLVSAVDHHGLHGIGIDENTAVVWEAARAPRVAGQRRVAVIDPALRIRFAEDGESVVL